MLKRLTITCILLCGCSAGFLMAKDDDIEFATSLGEAGYTWLAFAELERLEKEGDAVEKVLAIWSRAKLYESLGDFRKRDLLYDKFIKEAESSSDPDIRAKLQAVKGGMWDNKEQTLVKLSGEIDYQLTLGQDGDKIALAKARKDAKRIGEEIIRFRKETVNTLEAMTNRNQDQEIQLDQSKFFLGRTMFYYSYAFKGDDADKHKQVLKEAKEILSVLAFMYEDRVILIPYFSAMCSFEQEAYKDAANAFMKCIDFPADPRNEEIRKDAYFRAVRSNIKINLNKDAAMLAFDYLIEFPALEDKTSVRGHNVRYDLANALYNMDPAEYEEIKELFGYQKEKEQEAIDIAVKLESENGPVSALAREFVGEKAEGHDKFIAEGQEYYLNKEYNKAISSLQKGLKEASKVKLNLDARMGTLAKAWYYLGFAYYHNGMSLPAVICFKEGTTRYMLDFKEKNDRLTADQKQWFLSNRDNWKNVSGMYYRDTKSDLALDIFKEALIAYGTIDGGDDDGETGQNIHVAIAIILMRNDDFLGAIDELKKVPAEDPEYIKAQRIMGQCKWGQYIKGKETDKGLADEAFALFDKVEKMLQQKVDAAQDEEDKKLFEKELANLFGRKIPMMYKGKAYQKIIDGIDGFWANPPKSKSIKASALLYQIFSLIKIKIDESTPEGLTKKIEYLAKGHELMKLMEREAPGDPMLPKITKNLGYTFYNYGKKAQAKQLKEAEDISMQAAGELLYKYIEIEAKKGEDVDVGVMLNVGDIIHERLKDFERSEVVTLLILKMFEPQVKGKYDPYDVGTKTMLDDIKEKMFDRTESRNEFDNFIDRMYDGKDTEGKSRKREYFTNRMREYWEEQPYMYEDAYEYLSLAIMKELGYSPDEQEKQAAQRDGNSAEIVEKFWADLFKAYERQTKKDPEPFKDILTFLDNSILVNNYKFRLGECYRSNAKLKESLPILKELDDYYISEPTSKWAVGDTYLELCENEPAGEQKAEYQTEAKNIYLWIMKHAPQDEEGTIDYWKAVMNIARSYELIGDAEGAKNYLVQTLKYGSHAFPNDGTTEKTVRGKVKELEKQIGGAQE